MHPPLYDRWADQCLPFFNSSNSFPYFLILNIFFNMNSPYISLYHFLKNIIKLMGGSFRIESGFILKPTVCIFLYKWLPIGFVFFTKNVF